MFWISLRALWLSERVFAFGAQITAAQTKHWHKAPRDDDDDGGAHDDTASPSSEGALPRGGL